MIFVDKKRTTLRMFPSLKKSTEFKYTLNSSYILLSNKFDKKKPITCLS